MQYRLRLVLLYKDGTRNELKVQVPEDVGGAIKRKGMTAARVFVEELIQGFVPGNLNLEDFTAKIPDGKYMLDDVSDIKGKRW